MQAESSSISLILQSCHMAAIMPYPCRSVRVLRLQYSPWWSADRVVLSAQGELHLPLWCLGRWVACFVEASFQRYRPEGLYILMENGLLW